MPELLSPPTRSTRAPSRTRHRLVRLLAVLLLVVPALTGCVRAQLTMGVSSDDQVSGLLVLAAPQGGTAPTVTVPAALGSAVTVDPYQEGEYTGSQVSFTELSFAQLQTLTTSLTSEGAGTYSLGLRRSGDIVSLDGNVDLTGVPAGSGAEISVSVAFPVRVNTTNGSQQADNTVTWSTTGGDANLSLERGNLLQATASYADPSRRSFTDWTLLLGGVTLLVVVVVVLLALLSRDRSPRPGRVAR